MGSIFINSLKYLILFALILLLGCNKIDKKIEYQYGNMVITRIDKSSNSYFWYGEIKEGEEKTPDMKINWGGFDGGFRAYLLFESDHVELLAEYGAFEVVTPNKHFKISKKFQDKAGNFDNASSVHWFENISGKFEGVRVIQSPPYSRELQDNKDNHSQVSASVN